MSIDFRADQIRTNKIIASGSTGTGAALMIYSVSASTDLQGGIDTNIFSLLGVGTDVFMFVSGASGSIGTNIRGTTVFGGDVVVSGTLKIGSASIQILGNQNKVQFDPTVTIFKSASQLFFTDNSNPSPLSLTDLYNSTGAGSNWIEGTPSPRIRTTASVKIGAGSSFAEDMGSDVYFYVSGSRQRRLDGNYASSFPLSGLTVFQGATYHSGGIYIRHEGVTSGTGSLCFLWANSSQDKPLIQLLPPSGDPDSTGASYDIVRHTYGSVIYGSYQLAWNTNTYVRGGTTVLEARSDGSGNPNARLWINDPGVSNGFTFYLKDAGSGDSLGVAKLTNYSSPIFQLGTVYGVGLAARRDATIAGWDHTGGGFGNDNGVCLHIRPGLGTGTGRSFLRFYGVPTVGGGGTLQSAVQVLDIDQYGLKLKPLTEASRPTAASVSLTGSIYFSDTDRVHFYKNSTVIEEFYISPKSPYSSSLLTTDGTPTLLQAITLSLGVVYNIDSTIIAKQQDNLNRGRWIKNLLVYNSGGIAVIDGDIVYDIAPDRVSTSSFGMNFEVSGSALRLYVTGAAGVNVAWSALSDLIPA